MRERTDKRGWIRILEATIAAMIVAGVMLVTYTGQEGRDVTIEEYSESVQTAILADLVLRSDLRLAILNTGKDKLSDDNYEIVNDYVASQVPDGYGYLLRICNLSSESDYCKMTSEAYVATLDKDVFVEETVVGAEVGGGEGEEVYSPKKVKIYFWEGDLDPDTCLPECDLGDADLGCSADSRYVAGAICMEVDGCLIWAEEQGMIEDCGGANCVSGECLSPNGYELTCAKKMAVTDVMCEVGGVQMENNCLSWGHAGYTYEGDSDDISFPSAPGCDDLFYSCWDWQNYVTGACGESCPTGYTEMSRSGCVMCSDECSADEYYCSGNNLMRKSCGDYDADGCLEFGTGESATNCAAEGKKCEGGACVAVAPKVASVTASYSNLLFDGVKWYYDLTISESGGVGVTLNSRQRCWQYYDGCEAVQYDIVSKLGTDRISANGQAYSNGRWFWTSRHPQVMTETWYGVDDNGNSFQASYSISTN